MYMTRGNTGQYQNMFVAKLAKNDLRSECRHARVCSKGVS